MSQFCVVLVTCAHRAEAKRLAKALVAQKAAACVNILPGIESIYRWKGKVESAREVLLIAKSRLKSFPRTSRIIRQLHSYECPEIIALPVKAGDKRYLDWLRDNTNS